MKTKRLLIALLCAASVWLTIPDLSLSEGEGLEVVATAYTCEAHPNNPVHPCGNPRWGGNPHGWGMACPYWWRNQYMEVPGYGVLRCDDTGRYDTWNGYPHIDIRVPTYAQAYNFGIRRMTIYPVDAPPNEPGPSEGSEAQHTPTTTADDALALALAQAPKGDAETALIRLFRVATAHKHFPALLEGVPLDVEQPIWVVALWVPDSALPEGAVAKPDPAAEIAARFFIFDPKTSNLLADEYVSAKVIETLGWLPWDQVALQE